METMTVNTLTDKKNIGATIEKHLNEVGIYTMADLAEVTPAKAYLKICEKHPDKTFPVCYYLYSLEGALQDLHWDDLPEELKADLRRQVRK